VQTLYELLGALPDDDADRLRAAFTSAAKASHPDNNPDDAEASQKFRRVVRAYALLRDERQRTTYDAMLIKAEQQKMLIARNKATSRIQKMIPDPFVAVVIAFVSIGTYHLFERVLGGVSDVTMQAKQPPANVAALAAAMPMPQPQPPETISRAPEPESIERMPVSAPPEAADVVMETTATVTAAIADNAEVAPATPTVEVKDARYYRQRGQEAYRIGDLALALIDFDLAVELDPNLSDAYIDRAIVFHRMGDLTRAFADINEARRLGRQKIQQTTLQSDSH
jgi:tetratricopeptide (TPR) repeat protein